MTNELSRGDKWATGINRWQRSYNRLEMSYEEVTIELSRDDKWAVNRWEMSYQEVTNELWRGDKWAVIGCEWAARLLPDWSERGWPSCGRGRPERPRSPHSTSAPAHRPGPAYQSWSIENKTQLTPNQCCGSGSVGSICFWASWIRILLSSSKKSKRNLNSYCFMQCCGSLTFWGGSGSSDPCLWRMDPDPDHGSGSFYFPHWPSRCQQNTNFLTQSYIYIIFQR